MKVVLNKDIKGIGKKLQIVEVSEGYARNYLLPRKLASVADNKSLGEAKSKNEAAKFKKETEIIYSNRNLIENDDFRKKIINCPKEYSN